jgi:hypothetical protein
MTPLEELTKIIEDNPNCYIRIDNDSWDILSRELQEGDDENNEPKILADSSHFEYATEWYGHSTNYGVGIAEALLTILNKKGFNIKVHCI